MIVFVATLASKGMAFLPGYSSDDYVLSRKEAGINFFQGQGRYTEALIQLLTNQLGLYWTDIYFPNTVLLLIAYSFLIGTCTLALRREGQSLLIPAIGGVLIASHPYFSALLLFREASANTLFCLVMLVLFTKSWLSMIDTKAIKEIRDRSMLAAAALCAAIGCYQPALSIALCIGIPIIVQRVLLQSETPKIKFLVLMRASTPIVLALIGYIVINASAKAFLDVPFEQRNQLLKLQDVPGRLIASGHLLLELIISGTPISPRFLTGLLGVLFIAGVLCAEKKSRLQASIAFLLYPLLVAASIAPFTLSQVWWPVHRAMASVGFALGLLAILSMSSARRFGKILIAGWLFASWGLALHSSAMFVDQHRLNRWDFSRAQFIIHEVRRQFPTLADPEIHIVNDQWAYPTALSSSIADHGVSAFAVPWAVAQMMQEATGEKLSKVELQQTESSICLESQRWPSQASLHLIEGVVYVCL